MLSANQFAAQLKTSPRPAEGAVTPAWRAPMLQYLVELVISHLP